MVALIFDQTCWLHLLLFNSPFDLWKFITFSKASHLIIKTKLIPTVLFVKSMCFFMLCQVVLVFYFQVVAGHKFVLDLNQVLSGTSIWLLHH